MATALFARLPVAPTLGAASVHAVSLRRADCVLTKERSSSPLTALVRSPPRAFTADLFFVLLRSGEFGSRGSKIMPADAELSSLLSRRQRINDELEEGKEVKKQYKFVNVYTEFHELSRREIKQYEQTFNR